MLILAYQNKSVMLDFHIEGTEKTPTIRFDNTKSALFIQGKSLGENPYQFYMPLFHWMEIFEENPLAKLDVIVNLEYFNTSSSKVLLDIYKRLEEIHLKKKSEITIKWYYDEQDDDMRDIGKEYNKMLKLPFKLYGITQ